ncbi:MAG: hypothetical protein R6V41_03440 [Desulfobacteraceae bacterium]
MQLQDFCSQMEKQLSSYKESLSKIEHQLDAGGSSVKQQILPIVGDIKNSISELEMQKERLEKECPSDWSDDKSKLEGLVGEIGSSVDRAWEELSQGNVGG